MANLASTNVYGQLQVTGETLLKRNLNVTGDLILDGNLALGGGASGNILQWSVNGIPVWKTNGTTSQYLRGDGTWATPPNTVYNHPPSHPSSMITGLHDSATTGAATTATTLATARTINGTSFNGSANITTANWGTARTITIGGTGKSVNGSGNISWSLAEIGAEPVQAANRKRQIFVQSATPSGATTGDIWIVT